MKNKRGLLAFVAILYFCCVPLFSSHAATKKYGANFYPPAGKVLHIAGQTRDDIDDYIKNVSDYGKECPMPAGLASYTSLTLTGLDEPYMWSSPEVQHLSYTISKYNNTALQVAVWLGREQFEPIIAGTYDANIAKLAEYFKKIKRPVYLRIGYEFDNPFGSQYDPELYKKSYRRIVEGLAKAGAKNISYVWHSYAMRPNYRTLDPMEWYPGDAYVNWVGISTFEITKEQEKGTNYYYGNNRDRLLKIAREKNMPVMICEASPTKRTQAQKEKKGQAYWDFWFVPFFDFIEKNPEVRAFSYINCDWNAVEGFKSNDWGDSRLKEDAVVLRNWQKKMRDGRYLHSSANLYNLLGYNGK